MEVRLWLPWFVVRAQTQILIQLVGLNDLAGIHFPLRIPERFELPESLHQLRTKHFRQQFRARLTVAMLARERPAEADDQIGGLFCKLAIVGDAFFGLQIEVDPHVYAGVPKVSVEGATVAVAFHHLVQIAKIAAEFFGGDGGILPTLPAGRLPGYVGSGSQSRLPHFPDSLRLLLM